MGIKEVILLNAPQAEEVAPDPDRGEATLYYYYGATSSHPGRGGRSAGGFWLAWNSRPTIHHTVPLIMEFPLESSFLTWRNAPRDWPYTAATVGQLEANQRDEDMEYKATARAGTKRRRDSGGVMVSSALSRRYLCLGLIPHACVCLVQGYSSR